MSNSNEEPVEDMDVDISEASSSSYNSAQDSGCSSQGDEEALITLSVKWSEHDRPQRLKIQLELLLQTWFNKRKRRTDCSVLKTLDDGNFEIKIKPAPALMELQELNGQTLTSKDKKTVTILSISLTPQHQETQIPDDASVNHPPSSTSKPQDEQMNLKGQNGFIRAATVSAAEEKTSLMERQDLNGQTLTRDGKTATIMSSNPPPQQETQIPDDVSVKPSLSSVSEPQDEKMNLEEQNDFSSAAAGSAPGKDTCIVPVSHVWYMSHIYKEEIKSIEKENGVKIVTEAKVTFEPEQKNGGDPQKALYEFTNLVQKCIGDSNSSVVPLKFVDPDAWSDTMKIIQKNEKKVLVTLTSEEVTICGPSQSQEVISKYINDTQKFLNTYNSAGESQDTSLKISMNIKDPLADEGLSIEESHWKLMTASFSENIANIKSKFGVEFKVSHISKGRVNVRACYKGSGGNPSMESHAVRALLHLCQKITTSPMNFTQLQGASGISGSPRNLRSDDQSEGASSEPETLTTGATGEDNKDEKCCICMDTFTNKRRLKCKHEFCDECLKKAEKSMGPICPVCKDVFGVIEGDQPEGTMSWKIDYFSLPGFPHCQTIIITYNIPGGRQTEKHPNPGKFYHGIIRTAYLPDNREGREVLQLLERAFNQRLIFTVGTSRTTGVENQVTWNDIHHKTSTSGGPESFGYPDPGYLSRVREELKAKGIK